MQHDRLAWIVQPDPSSLTTILIPPSNSFPNDALGGLRRSTPPNVKPQGYMNRLRGDLRGGYVNRNVHGHRGSALVGGTLNSRRILRTLVMPFHFANHHTDGSSGRSWNISKASSSRSQTSPGSGSSSDEISTSHSSIHCTYAFPFSDFNQFLDCSER